MTISSEGQQIMYAKICTITNFPLGGILMYHSTVVLEKIVHLAGTATKHNFKYTYEWQEKHSDVPWNMYKDIVTNSWIHSYILALITQNFTTSKIY